jgi:hypothetical protein
MPNITNSYKKQSKIDAFEQEEEDNSVSSIIPNVI